jgi:hypothetical protein
MSYQLIDFYIKEDRLFLTATVDDTILVHPQTLYDPPEFGPALCEGSLYLDDDISQDLTTMEDVQSYLDSSMQEPDWQIIDNS